MGRWLGVILLCGAVLSVLGQTPSFKYQPGTIMAVTIHQNPGQHDNNVTQYDVSVKVGNTTYVVLYTPINGANTVTYAEGDELLVLVGSKTLAFNSPSGKVEVPILRHDTLPAQSLDPSKSPGQYFSLKLRLLSENLALTDGQQAEIKPLLEQEAGQVGQVCANPDFSRADKLSQYENIARTSDEQIKPLLSASQVQKLRDLRKQQKQDLERIIAEQKSSKQK
jgi:hypothetical protein